MINPIRTIRCRKCNQILQGLSFGHICPKQDNPIWKTKVNSSRGRVEARNIRLKFMEDNPKLFKRKKIIK